MRYVVCAFFFFFFTGCLSLETFESKYRQGCMAPMHKLAEEHTPTRGGIKELGQDFWQAFPDKWNESFHDVWPEF